MKKIVLFSAYALLIGIYSCKKDAKTPAEEPVADPPKVYANYSNLKVGNYWIYERFDIDPSGNATSLHIIDSCYVEKDTVINGHICYKYSSPYGYPNVATTQYPNTFGYLRDSLSYIIEATHGGILFASEDFTTEFATSTYTLNPNDTVYTYKQKMGNKDMSYTTPAGTFITSSMQDIYKMYPNYNSCTNNIRIIETRYAENIGKISESFLFFSGNCNHSERRLIRYHLN
jgi:hypothetical protein